MISLENLFCNCSCNLVRTDLAKSFFVCNIFVDNGTRECRETHGHTDTHTHTHTHTHTLTLSLSLSCAFCHLASG